MASPHPQHTAAPRSQLSRAADIATILVAACALTLTTLLLTSDRASGSRRSEEERVEDWRQFAADGSRVGPPDAAVTILEFGDYECAFCRRFEAEVRRALGAYPDDVAFVFRHFPLSYHAHAATAAQYASCADDQRRFETAHNVLIAAKDLGALVAGTFAAQTGLPDVDAFVACVQQPSLPTRVLNDMAAAERLGVQATPTVLVNGTRLVGTPDSARLFQAIEREFERLGIAARRRTTEPTVPLVLRPETVIDGSVASLLPIGDALVLADGSLAVTQPQDQHIRIFDAEGRTADRIGRRGSGPGEFQAVSRIGKIRDTLWVLDGRARRFTLFTKDASRWRPARQIVGPFGGPSSVGNSPSTGPSITPLALSARGLIIASVHTADQSSDLRLILLEQDGLTRRAVATFPSPENDPTRAYFHRFPDGTSRGRLFPFAPTPITRYATDGSMMAHATQAIEPSGIGRIDVLLLGTAGDTLARRTVRRGGVPIPEAARDSAIARAHAALLRPLPGQTAAMAREAADAWRRRVETPRSYPPLVDLRIGADSSLWLTVRDGSSGVRLLRLPKRGPTQESDRFPANARALAADARQVWVVEEDEMEVPSLRRFRMP